MNEYDQELIDGLPSDLKAILTQELEAGNVIAEVAGGWPMKKVNVWLHNEFHRNYREQFPDLEYLLVNDPHYWGDEYLDRNGGAMVATRFQLNMSMHLTGASRPPETGRPRCPVR